jgi:hypothetical protein
MSRKQDMAFPEVANIRKGTPKYRIMKGDKEIEVMGKDLGQKMRVHFLPGTDTVKAAFHVTHAKQLVNYPEKYLVRDGYEVLELRAVVPATSVWAAWDYGNEIYQSGRRLGLADDDHYIYLKDPLDGNKFLVKDGQPFKKFLPKEIIKYERGNKHFELTVRCSGRLRLVLEDMVNAGELVQFILKTTSWYDCQNIKLQLAGIQTIADLINGGNAGGVPFVIYRSQKEITWNHEDGTASRVKQWLINIKADPDWVKHAFARMSKNALTGEFLSRAMLPATVEGVFNPDQDELEGEHEDEGRFAPPETTGVYDVQVRDKTPTPIPVGEPPQQSAGPGELPKQPAGLVEPPPPPTEGTQIERPLIPLTLRSMLVRKASNKKGEANPGQVGLMVSMMEYTFAPDPDAAKIRRSCLMFLWGVDSSKKMTGPQILAMLDWLKPVKDTGGSYTPDPMAVRELKAVWEAEQIAKGQTVLPGMEE